MSSRFILALVLATMLASGVSCAPAIRPAPVPTAPTPPPPVIAAPAPTSSWTMSAVLPSTRYLVSVAATLERDSAGRVLRELVESRGIITLQARRDPMGNLRGSGVVDSFTVRGLERALAPADGATGVGGRPTEVLPLIVAFDAVLDSTTMRVTTRPPLANECDRPEGGATNLVRELLIRIPRTVVVGAVWRDSSVAYMCRLGIPITSRTRAQYTVERVEQVDARTDLLLRRTTDTQLEGGLRTTWRTVVLGGSGHATQSIRVDASTGVVHAIDGEGTLTVRLTDSARRDATGTQEIRQSTISRLTLRPTVP